MKSAIDIIMDEHNDDLEVIEAIAKMNLSQMITYISDRKTLTISGWNDRFNSVRVGTDWNIHTGELEGDGFLIERNNLELAVRDNLEVLMIGFNKWRAFDNKRKKDTFSYVKTYLHMIDEGNDDKTLLDELDAKIRCRYFLPIIKSEIIERMRSRVTTEHGYKDAPLYKELI